MNVFSHNVISENFVTIIPKSLMSDDSITPGLVNSSDERLTYQTKLYDYITSLVDIVHL